MTKYLNELYLKDKSESNKLFKAVALGILIRLVHTPSGIIGEDVLDNTPNNLMLYLLAVANHEFPFLNIFGGDYNTPDGSGIRDFIHVVDLAKGHVAAIKYFDIMDNYYEVFNLGTGSGHTVFELVRTFEKINNIVIPTRIAPRRPGELVFGFCDSLMYVEMEHTHFFRRLHG